MYVSYKMSIIYTKLMVLIITENYQNLPESTENLPITIENYQKLSNNYSIGFRVRLRVLAILQN